MDVSLNLPTYAFRTTEQDGKRFIYDPIRGTYVRLTPEEWVRQHILQYLIQELDTPAGWIAVEMAVPVQEQPQRADLVVHDRGGAPLLLVECKAPGTPIRQAVFDQSARYNTVLGAPFLAVTNGHEHYACAIDFATQEATFLDDLPPYEELLAMRS
jgi:type I site-specific restriction endonuclease